MITDKEISIFCNNVKLLRKQHHLSRQEMAEICAISVEDIIEIERGYLPLTITVDIAIRLFQHFDISPEKLFRPF